MTFTGVDPDVLDEIAAYGTDPEPVDPTEDDRTERMSRAFERGVTLRLDAPPIDGATGDEPVAEPTVNADGTPKRRRGRKPGSGRAVGGAQLGDLFMAGFAIAIGFAVGEWAAPTDAESKAIAQPLGNILARRIDLASKLGRDTDDTVNLAIALMAYMARVGPIAAGRGRNAWAERNQRAAAARVDRPPTPVGSPNDRGTGNVVDGRDGVPSAPYGATRNPLDAVAASAQRGLGYLDRNLGSTPRPTPTVAD